MAWAWDEIDGDWLLGNRLTLAPADVVAAFDAVEAEFGRDWIEESRRGPGRGPARGTGPTLHVVTLGRHLLATEHLRRRDRLLRDVRSGSENARAELTAAALIIDGDPDVECDYEPEIAVGARTRKADLRVRKPGEDWTYVEVTQPSRSEAQKLAFEVMGELAQVLDLELGSYAAEVFFWRQPRPDEVGPLREVLREACRTGGVTETSLKNGLGTIYVNREAPGHLTTDDHGREYTPRVSRMDVRAIGAQPDRSVAVRWPFFDDRGTQFLATEAGQLSEDQPGLLMIQMSGAAGGMKKWPPVLESELALGLYNSVSAICLFQSGLVDTGDGEAWQPTTFIIPNTTASQHVPEWLEARLRALEETA